MATKTTAGGTRRRILGAVAALGVAAVPLALASPASAATPGETVTFVPSAIDTSGFGPHGGTVNVTYTPAFDAAHPAPDLSACGIDSIQSFSVPYTVTQQRGTGAYIAYKPDLTYVNPAVNTNHTTNGVEARSFTFDIRGSELLDANDAWDPTLVPLTGTTAFVQGLFEPTFRGVFPVTTVTMPYVPLTASTLDTANFIPTQYFSITGGAVPSAQPGLGNYSTLNWMSVESASTWAGDDNGHVTRFAMTMSVDDVVTGDASYAGEGTSEVKLVFADSTGNWSNGHPELAVAASGEITRGLTFSDVTAVTSCEDVVVPMVDETVAAGAGVAAVAVAGAFLVARRRRGGVRA